MSLLSGIKVLDAASFIAGPAATTVMSDFGADVIKIEPPGSGDTYRRRDAPGNPQCDVNYAWLLDNRNKRSIELDLKSSAGKRVLARMIARSDVFVTNLPQPARERLSVRYDDLRAHNDRLIYATISAYGERGPDAHRSGFDSTALWARSSLMAMAKPGPDSAPVRSLPGMGDHPTAISLFGAIMAALYRRERTGEGSQVHTSLMANGLWWNSIQVQAMLCGAEYQVRPPREQATNALHNLYQSADGRWFHIILIPEEKRWPKFLQAMQCEALGLDPRFEQRAGRAAHAGELVAELDRVFSGFSWVEIRDRLEQAEIPYGAVANLRDVLDDEQMYASDALTPIDNAGGGVSHVVNSPLWIEQEPKVRPKPAPELGEHTDDVLREFGFDESELAQLRVDGAIPA